MLLQYGPISLNLLSVDAYERTAVMHGPNYLGTKHKIAVTARYNPSVQSDHLDLDKNATTFDAAGNLLDSNGNPLPLVPNAPNALPLPVGDPLPSPAGLPFLGSDRTAGRLIPPGTRFTGAYTAVALKHQLMQPRQRLVFSLMGTILLQSPIPGLTVDSNLGPTPISCDVVKMKGCKTLEVRFVIETVVNEAPLFGVGSENFLHAVLSHRWSMEHDLAENYFATRIVRGRVIFRADVLDKFNLNPDDFRRYFFYPVPSGWKRDSVKVKALDDQVTIDYEVVDRQLPIGWVGAGIAKVEATHTVHLHKPNFLDIAVEGLAEAAKEIGAAVSRGAFFKEGESVLGASIAAAGVQARVAYKTLPVIQHHVAVHVWGGPASTRKSLRDFAIGICTTRLAAFATVNQTAFGGADLKFTDVVTGKEVLVEMSLISPPTPSLIGNFRSLLTGGTTNVVYFPPDDATGILLAQGETPEGPTDDFTGRDASYLEICVAGSLTDDAAQGNQAAFDPAAPRDRADQATAPPAKF